MARCIVIGSTARALSVANLLSAGGVPSRAFAPAEINVAKLARICAGEKGLEVVAMFSGDLSKHAEALLRELRSVLQKTKLHVFRDASSGHGAAVRPTEHELKKAGASAITSAFPVSPEYAAAMLKRFYFPGLQLSPSVERTVSYRDTVSHRRQAEDMRGDGENHLVEDDESSGDEDEIPMPEQRKKAEVQPQLRSPNRAERRAQGIFGKKNAEARTARKAPTPRQPLVVRAPSVPQVNTNLNPEVQKQEEERWKAIIARVRKAMANASYVTVDPAEIQRMEGQPRQYFDEIALQELAYSISEVGQFQPGMIRFSPKGDGRKYELLDGERRWRAVVIAGIRVYKAMLVEIDDEAAPYMIAAIANFHREGHTPLEISDSIEKLNKGLNMPIPVIAKNFKISEFWANQLHGLQKLHPQIRLMLGSHIPERQRLPITAAIQVSKLHASAQAELVEEYRAKRVTLKGLRRAALALAEKTGTYIRKREWREPARIAGSAQKNASATKRHADDLHGFLKEKPTQDALAQQQKAAALIRKTLTDAKWVIDQCQRLLPALAHQS